jgi:hypothetical protein
MTRAKNVSQEAAVKKMLPRSWAEGDVYAPKELGKMEAERWAYLRRGATEPDPFEKMGRNPLEFYKVSTS